ncbi:MAG: hypothetical protein GX777_06310 [Fastidiosipila sp.]|nr:hypothetical protein [Fastidiosipila sp.]
MNNLQNTVGAVLKQQKQQLAPSTFEARRIYLNRLVVQADTLGISVPCQELFDAFVSKAVTPDLHFQLYHAVRLVDKEAGTKAFTPEGRLYNEPDIPTISESEKKLQDRLFPIADDSVDTGYLIRRAESEMKYLNLSASTCWQYMQAWRELYVFLYLHGNTAFSRDNCHAFIEESAHKKEEGSLHEWKRKIRRRATLILIEVADTGCFKWKLFISPKICCTEKSLEELRQQYIEFLRNQNLEKKTIYLYDYVFRGMIEGLGVSAINDLNSLTSEQIQIMLLSFSEKLCLNSKGTIFPIIRKIFSYLYFAGFTPTDFSGVILTPAYQSMHLKPYITSSDE